MGIFSCLVVQLVLETKKNNIFFLYSRFDLISVKNKKKCTRYFNIKVEIVEILINTIIIIYRNKKVI